MMNALNEYVALPVAERKRNVKTIARSYNIPGRTFGDYVACYNVTIDEILRSGPEPILSNTIETDIADWVVARAANNLPVTCGEIVVVANACASNQYSSGINANAIIQL